MADMVNHPDHYISKNGLEVIDVIEAFTDDLSGMEAVCTANAIKYICRWKNKNGVEDIRKAIWYLNRLIGYETTKQSCKPSCSICKSKNNCTPSIPVGSVECQAIFECDDSILIEKRL